MKWVLIIIILSSGWGNRISQIQTGRYLTEKACLNAAEYVPKELPAKRTTITAMCLPVGE